MTRVAVVTGSNKGIGLSVVRGLCKSKEFEGDVFLTARDEGRGREAVEQLKKEGLSKSPKFHQLDISDPASVERLKKFLQQNYGGLDVLVNNAAMAYKAKSTVPFPEQADVSMQTNFWANLAVCNKLFPILKPHARVVNVASFVTDMAIQKCSPVLQDRIKNPKITMAELETLMKEFVQAAKDGSHESKGWPSWAYAVTKIGVRVMSMIQQRDLDAKEDIIVNSCDPGWVQTDMTSGSGKKTPDEGADTLIYLALLPPNTKSPKGEFVGDRTIKKWE